jgi:hypothetical protein
MGIVTAGRGGVILANFEVHSTEVKHGSDAASREDDARVTTMMVETGGSTRHSTSFLPPFPFPF